MSDMKFEVDMAAYRAFLERGTKAGIFAVAEQVATDTNLYVKYDQGTLHDSQRIERGDAEVSVTWDTPYAMRQYYTGTPIDHGRGNPHLQWAEYAESVHRREWDAIMVKAFAESMARKSGSVLIDGTK